MMVAQDDRKSGCLDILVGTSAGPEYQQRDTERPGPKYEEYICRVMPWNESMGWWTGVDSMKVFDNFTYDIFREKNFPVRLALFVDLESKCSSSGTFSKCFLAVQTYYFISFDLCF